MTMLDEWRHRAVAAGPRTREAVARRLLRLDLGLLPAVPRVLVVCCWAMTVVVAWLLMLPGVVDTIALAAPGLHHELSFIEPPWYRAVFFVAAATVATSFAAVVTLHLASPARRQRRLVTAVGVMALAALAGYPALLLAADWSRLGTFVALAATIAVVVASLLPSAQQYPALRVAGVTVFTAIAWLAMIGAQQSPSGGYDWAWNGVTSAGVVVAIFGGVFAIARAARSRSLTTNPFARREVDLRAAAIAVSAAVIVVVLRMTVARDWFGSREAEAWTMLGAQAWPHAVLVGLVIVYLAVRSNYLPRTPRAQGLVLTLLVLAATAPFVQWVFIFLTAAASAAFGGPVNLQLVVTSKLTLLAVALLPLLVVCLLPWSRGSIGRTAALVALAFYGPVLVGRLAQEVGGLTVPQYFASPAMVVVVIIGCSILLLAAMTITRRPLVPARVIALLAVVPLLTETAGLLLPDALSSVIGRLVLVAGSLAALLLSMPRVAADPLRRSQRAIRFVAFNLLVVASFALAIGQFAPYGDPVQNFAADWIAVPLGAALCCRIHGRLERNRVVSRADERVEQL
jgi:hypothetical protein